MVPRRASCGVSFAAEQEGVGLGEGHEQLAQVAARLLEAPPSGCPRCRRRASVSVAAGGEAEPLGGHAVADRLAARQLLAQLDHARRRRRPRRCPSSSPVASTGLPRSVVRHMPMASKFSKPKPMGSISWWQAPHTGLAMRATDHSRAVVVAVKGGFSSWAFGGGSGTGWHSSCSRTKMPAEDQRGQPVVGGAVRRQEARPGSARPTRWPGSSVTFWKASPVGPVDAVVGGQRPVHEGVGRGQQACSACRRPSGQDVLEERVGLAPQGLAQLGLPGRQGRRRPCPASSSSSGCSNCSVKLVIVGQVAAGRSAIRRAWAA